jgi:hypothetical protein
MFKCATCVCVVICTGKFPCAALRASNRFFPASVHVFEYFWLIISQSPWQQIFVLVHTAQNHSKWMRRPVLLSNDFEDLSGIIPASWNGTWFMFITYMHFNIEVYIVRFTSVVTRLSVSLLVCVVFWVCTKYPTCYMRLLFNFWYNFVLLLASLSPETWVGYLTPYTRLTTGSISDE